MVKSIRIVLVEPEGKINMGFIIRLARNFDISDICVINPKFDINDPEVIEFSAKGADIIKDVKIVNDFNECLMNIDYSICTTSKGKSDSDVLRQAIDPELINYILPDDATIAIVFGRESVGLRRNELKMCDLLTTITTSSEYNVFNLSHAVSILLYILTKKEKKSKILSNHCDVKTRNYILKYINEISKQLNNEDAYIALKHILNKAGITRAECSHIYKFFKRLYFELIKSQNT